MAPAEKILDRIRKLHAKAESAKAMGSMEEAQTFAARVSEMLAQHKLDLSDLEMTQLESREPIAEGHMATGMGNKRVAWVEALVGTIARAHFCRIVVVPRTSAVYVVGRKSDREIVEWMSGWMIPFVWELSHKEMMAARKREKAAGNYYGARGFRTSFLNGFVTRMGERFRAMRATVETAARASGKGTALVHISNADKQVAEYVEWRYTRNASSVGQQTSNTSGYGAGRAAADRVSLNRPVGGGSTGGAGRLGA